MAEQTTTQERNARLDALLTATEEWAARHTQTLKDQVALSKRVLKGRTGSERLAQASVQSVSDLAVSQINDFLTGE
jgi:hypothetical protein